MVTVVSKGGSVDVFGNHVFVEQNDRRLIQLITCIYLGFHSLTTMMSGQGDFQDTFLPNSGAFYRFRSGQHSICNK